VGVLCATVGAGAENVECQWQPGDEWVSAVARVLFNPGADCLPFDRNGDGAVTVADMVREIRSAASALLGPRVKFLGLAGADGTVISPWGSEGGLIVYQRPGGSGFQLVVEAAPGASGAAVGSTVVTISAGIEGRPDLQIFFSRPLGNGDPALCDGGVPGVTFPDFRDDQPTTAVLQDGSCGFTVAVASRGACTVDEFGAPRFVSAGTGTVQFCALVPATRAFPIGDTLVTVRVRDRQGNL